MTKGLSAAFERAHIETPLILLDAADVDAMFDALPTGRHDRACASVHALDRPRLPSGYFDHQLYVGVDRVAGVGVLSLADEGNLATKGALDRGVVEYMLLGHAKEFMPGSEIPLPLVRRAVKEFLANGGRLPTCVDWQDEEPWHCGEFS